MLSTEPDGDFQCLLLFDLGDSEIKESGRETAASRPSVRKLSHQVLAEVLSGGADIGSLIRAPDGRAPRILVGDADPAIRERLHRALFWAGCQVEELTDRWGWLHLVK